MNEEINTKRIEALKYLIQQTEERIKIVDTKASIIIAFFGILFSSNVFFQKIVTNYGINIWYCYFIISLLAIAFVYLILTIRPPQKKSKLLWDFKNKSSVNKKEGSGFWLVNEAQINRFKIIEITQFVTEYEFMFKQLALRRVKKYRYFRIALQFVRYSLVLIIIGLLYIFYLSK